MLDGNPLLAVSVARPARGCRARRSPPANRKSHAHDAIIIGARLRRGLAAATQLGRARRKGLVLDTARARNRFAAHSHGFFTRDGVRRRRLIDEARRRRLAIYQTVELRTGRAIAASQQGEDFEVELETGERLPARRLILAHGMIDDISVLPQGIDAVRGKTVFFCLLCHGFEVADRRLGLLLRHGDVLELALLLQGVDGRFHAVHQWRAGRCVARKALADMNVPIIDDTVMSFEHDDGWLRAVVTAAGRCRSMRCSPIRRQNSRPISASSLAAKPRKAGSAHSLRPTTCR